MTDTVSFAPDWVVPPGESIRDWMDEHNSTVRALAQRLDLTEKHVHDLLASRVAITADVANRLGTVLGPSAAFWANLQANYEAERARLAKVAQLDASAVAWVKSFPLKDLEAWGVRRFKAVGEQAMELLRWFRVSSVDAWESVYGARVVAYRTSPRFESEVGGVTAWLRRGEELAEAMACAPWDPSGFKRLLPELRALTREPEPEVFLPVLQRRCADVGVAVVWVPAPKGCAASGATFFVGDTAVLMLSGRYKRDDQLWFSFFHEAGHLVRHGKKRLFLEGEGMTGDEEAEADRFAADTLIPPSEARALATLLAPGEVRAFADRLGIAPGIVVGRMQREGIVRYSELNDLVVRYK